MSIKERIENIKEYFDEMQIITVDGVQVIYVLVTFPNGWIIDPTLEAEYNITIGEGRINGEYFFSTEMANGEEVLFNAINKNIKKMKAAIERAELLKAKTAELKDIFTNEDNSLEYLRTLNFTFGTPLVQSTETTEKEEPIEFIDYCETPMCDVKTKEDRKNNDKKIK
jgi:hypothetical protein